MLCVVRVHGLGEYNTPVTTCHDRSVIPPTARSIGGGQARYRSLMQGSRGCHAHEDAVWLYAYAGRATSNANGRGKRVRVPRAKSDRDS